MVIKHVKNGWYILTVHNLTFFGSNPFALRHRAVAYLRDRQEASNG